MMLIATLAYLTLSAGIFAAAWPVTVPLLAGMVLK
jgi:hypothetical protein